MGWMTEGLEFKSRQGQEFSLLHAVQTGSGVHPTSYPIGTGGSFSGGKAVGAWIASNERMTCEWWIGYDLEGNGRSLIKVLALHMLDGLRKTKKYPQSGDFPAEIQTENFPNTSL
jgi:hypothetical protein